MFGRIGWIGLVMAWAASALAQGPARPEQGACVPLQELSMRGIPVGADGGAVRLLLGNPRGLGFGQSEDSGGLYKTATLRYRELEVVVGRPGTQQARVERLSTRSPRVPLPSGVRVGMRWEEALALWKVPPEAAQPAEGGRMRVRLCEEIGHPVAVPRLEVALDGAGRIQEIEIAGHGP